jgi:hypothetical protein
LVWAAVVCGTARDAIACSGNCDGGAAVTINELLLCVNSALDVTQLASCRPCDDNGDGAVTVNELVRAVRSALGAQVDIAGNCLRPGQTGLAPCTAGSPLSVARCEDPAVCLRDPAALTPVDIGCAGDARCIDSVGAFSLTIDDCRAFGATLLLTATVDADSSSEYRAIDIGPAGFGAAGDIGSGAGSDRDVIISPASEAAVRLLDQGGLENFDRDGIVVVQQAVEAANQATDFEGLSAAAAAELAEAVAMADPVVEATVVSALSPTRTATATPTPRPTEVTLYVGSAAGAPGATVSVSVTLGAADMDVVGTENELVLPAGVQALAAGGAADCTVNPAIDKDASSFTLQPPGCTPATDCTGIKAIVFDLSNVDPISDGAVLYTCRLRIAAGAAPGMVPVICAAAFYSPPPPPPIPAPSAECDGGEIAIIELP